MNALILYHELYLLNENYENNTKDKVQNGFDNVKVVLFLMLVLHGVKVILLVLHGVKVILLVLHGVKVSLFNLVCCFVIN
jgi:hypothetical protein